MAVSAWSFSTAIAQNPYLPLWEYIPDGEPYVFEDPDKPGQQRVYIYGSHDSRVTDYCGLEQVVWSAPIDDLNSWRYDGIIFKSEKDRDGNPLNPDGKVFISEGEFNSEGFATSGLNPQYKTPAGLACYLVGPSGSSNSFPNFTFSGSYIKPTYFNPESYEGPFNQKMPYDPIVNNTAGSTVGYKYFDFSKIDGTRPVEFVCHLIPQGIEGKVSLLIDSPYRSKGGKDIGCFVIDEAMPMEMAELKCRVSGLDRVNGKHPLYLLFESDTKGKSICELYDFQFISK